VIYFDSPYIVRLYLDDPGWEAVRKLSTQAPVACCAHGFAEVVSAVHRKFREDALTRVQYRQVLEQFAVDCSEKAFNWLPLTSAVTARVALVYETLPKTAFFLRAADAIHLACAAENHFREVYTNDRRLLSAAQYFGLSGLNVI